MVMQVLVTLHMSTKTGTETPTTCLKGLALQAKLTP
jgi:hypothetical protein